MRIRLLALLATLLLLAGCGQKGPLRLESDPDQAVNSEQKAAQAKSAEEKPS